MYTTAMYEFETPDIGRRPNLPFPEIIRRRLPLRRHDLSEICQNCELTVNCLLKQRITDPELECPYLNDNYQTDLD